MLIEVCAKTFIEISVEKMSKKGVSAFKLIYTIITDFSWLFVCFSLKDPICRITQWNCGRLNNGPQDGRVLIPRTYDILYGKGDFAGVVKLRILGWGECPGLFRSAQCFEDRGRKHTPQDGGSLRAAEDKEVNCPLEPSERTHSWGHKKIISMLFLSHQVHGVLLQQLCSNSNLMQKYIFSLFLEP